jgi:hypothetical protein
MYLYPRIRPGDPALALLFFCVSSPWVPELTAQVNSRAEEIELAREEKSKHLEPDELSKTENALRRIKEEKILERISQGVAGFRVKLGG